MSEHPYKLPNYKREKLYSPYRCPICYKILRIKIFKNNTVKYTCQCKREWFISFSIYSDTKPRKLDSCFRLRCSKCHSVCSPDNKYLTKCITCNQLFHSKPKCQETHEHYNFKNLIEIDVTCDTHSKDFIAYCKDCDKDICEECLNEEEENHNIIYYKEILPKKEDFIFNYNNFNSLGDKFVTLFKGNARKYNYRLIYYFHLREIIRNIYFNFSRLSIYNKYNFALISNVLENSDYITYNEKTSPWLILNEETAPTCFLNSSEYILTFLDNKISDNKKELLCCENLEIFSSFPKGKYLLFIEGNDWSKNYNIFKIYETKKFELIYTVKDYFLSDKYNFEDEKLICPSNKNNSILVLNINSKTNKVEENIITFPIKYDNIYLMDEYILCKKNTRVEMYQKTKKIDEIILDNPKGGFCDFCCVHNCLVYHDKKNVHLWDMNTKNEIILIKDKSINSIRKIDKKNIIISSSWYSKYSKFYIFNASNKQIINIYKMQWDKNNLTLLNNYFVHLKEGKLDFIDILTYKLKRNQFHILKDPSEYTILCLSDNRLLIFYEENMMIETISLKKCSNK